MDETLMPWICITCGTTFPGDQEARGHYNSARDNAEIVGIALMSRVHIVTTVDVIERYAR